MNDTSVNEAVVEVMKVEIRALRYELNYAYRGIETLPEHHPARLVYERTASLESRSQVETRNDP